LLVLRTLYGVAMGGEWGVGASLTMESIPPKTRGIVSGILQAGYPSGYLLVSIVYGVLFTTIGWRGMFMIGALLALLVLYIRSQVDESPAFAARGARVSSKNIWQVIRGNLGLFVFSIVLMTAFNFFSHGTQDLYPTFLEVQHKLSPQVVGAIAVVYNIGAIIGGLFFGSLSEHIGRRRAIVIAALLALPVIPLWAYGTTPVLLAIGAFLMQVAVQGTWASSRPISTSCRLRKCAAPSPASPTSSAICWPRAMPRCRPASRTIMVATTPLPWRWSPAWLPSQSRYWRASGWKRAGSSSAGRRRTRPSSKAPGHHGRSIELVTCSRSGEVKHRPTQR
jgi:MFS family permease